MEENKYIFRAVNPRSDEDIQKYIDLKSDLDSFLKIKTTKKKDENFINWQRWHLGAPEYVFPEDYKNKPLGDVEKLADEFVFICEIKGDAVGYIQVANYHLINGKRPDDDIGIIGEIYLKPEHRKTDLSLQLLKLGVKRLIQCGKFKAFCNVQKDNKNRYLHFAMADGNIVHEDICKRNDGSTTIDYTLMIDLNNLYEDIIGKRFIRKIAKYHKMMVSKEEGLTL